MGIRKQGAGRPGRWLWGAGLAAVLAAAPAWSQTSVSRDIEKPVQQAIDTRQSAQDAQEKWDGAREKLVAAYERLKAEKEQLEAVRARLAKEAARQEKVNRALAEEQAEARRIQDEMMPFLKSVTGRIDEIRAHDAPFLVQERRQRLSRLEAILEDPEVSGAEKYRKTMEALFVEAEYGNTVEVYQEKIMVDGAEVLGDIFRLGRVSLFFLTLDRATAAVFDVARDKWVVLDGAHVPSVAAAVEMAAKHRPMEVIALPLGRLGRGEGGSHE
ncbi:MAG: DUF3450 domain-containing protein [Desulfobacter sp.]|nr:MAG: DUF3450 domain-containing protein [Desulfobacter sp.]